MRNSQDLLEPLNDKFIIRAATKQDLPRIIDIYNLFIDGKGVMAELTKRTVADKQAWFDSHVASNTRPIFLVTDKLTDQPVAWCNFSNLYQLDAFKCSAEVSIYIDLQYQNKGLGTSLIVWMLEKAPSYKIRNLVAKIFAHNLQSLALFKKQGFEQWGYLPEVCDMQGFLADVVILGRKV